MTLWGHHRGGAQTEAGSLGDAGEGRRARRGGEEGVREVRGEEWGVEGGEVGGGEVGTRGEEWSEVEEG